MLETATTWETHHLAGISLFACADGVSQWFRK